MLVLQGDPAPDFLRSEKGLLPKRGLAPKRRINMSNGKTIARVKKPFFSVYDVPIGNYPVAYKVVNTLLFGEFVESRMILAFGKYDLILCSCIEGKKHNDVYETKVVSCPYRETLPVSLDLLSKGGALNELEIKIYFSKPLSAKVEVVNLSSRVRIYDPVKNLTSESMRKVEIHVEGEITAELIVVKQRVEELTKGELEGEMAYDKPGHEERKQPESQVRSYRSLGIKVPNPVLSSPLGQVPSRPGLHRTFQQSEPPLKPPEGSG